MSECVCVFVCVWVCVWGCVWVRPRLRPRPRPRLCSVNHSPSCRMTPTLRGTVWYRTAPPRARQPAAHAHQRAASPAPLLLQRRWRPRRAPTSWPCSSRRRRRCRWLNPTAPVRTGSRCSPLRVRACVRACVRVCVRACGCGWVCAYVHAACALDASGREGVEVEVEVIHSDGGGLLCTALAVRRSVPPRTAVAFRCPELWDGCHSE